MGERIFQYLYHDLILINPERQVLTRVAIFDFQDLFLEI